MSSPVTDLDAAPAFQLDKLCLGAPHCNLPEPGWIEFSTGRESGNVSVTLPTPVWQPSAGTTEVLEVADCHSAVTELRRRGVRCDDPQVFPGYVTFAGFHDPFGNRLQMCSPA